MSNSNRVILLEANEHTTAFLDEFMGRGLMPNLSRLHAEAATHKTWTEETGDSLNPWVQWVTVHSGVEQAEHGIGSLGEGARYQGERIWDCVSAVGERSLICSSMNVRNTPNFKGYMIPDPWDSKTEPSEEVKPFVNFIQRAIQGHVVGEPFAASDVFAFIQFLVTHGLSFTAALDTFKQLVTECFNKQKKWRRATLLDQLQFDVFKYLYKREQPKFATFFTNSVAHLQHRYWRHHDPDAFKSKPSQEDINAYKAAIEHGYTSFDTMLGKLMALAKEENAAIGYCSALSQKPCLAWEDIGGKNVYRPKSFDTIIQAAGVDTPFEAALVMAQQANVFFESKADADEAEEKLKRLRFHDADHSDAQAFIVARCDDERIMLTFNFVHDIKDGARVTVGSEGEVFDFYQHFDKMGVEKSGSHHPEGIFWIWQPGGSHREGQERVSLTSIAPTLLEYMGIPASERMRSPSLNT